MDAFRRIGINKAGDLFLEVPTGWGGQEIHVLGPRSQAHSTNRLQEVLVGMKNWRVPVGCLANSVRVDDLVPSGRRSAGSD